MSDLIDRQAAIEALKICDRNCQLCSARAKAWNGQWINDEASCFQKLMADAKKSLESLPPAQPARKTGKWMHTNSETYTWMIKCDHCGHIRSMMSTHGMYPNYCEYCGADMRVSSGVTCKTCRHLIHEDPFYWCGLERTETSDADVTLNGRPLEIQPDWCKLRKEQVDDE